jgi:hypothetical protein
MCYNNGAYFYEYNIPYVNSFNKENQAKPFMRDFVLVE